MSPSTKRKIVKAWGVVTKRGSFWTPLVHMCSFPIFMEKGQARMFEKEIVHEAHRGQVVPVEIHYQLKGKK